MDIDTKWEGPDEVFDRLVGVANPERDFERAERIGSKEAWKAFVAQYAETPNSFYVRLAKAALARLETKSSKGDSLSSTASAITCSNNMGGIITRFPEVE